MIAIGMSLGGDGQTHALAVAIHEELRWQIYSSKSFRHPAKLWEMQTLLIREIYDKMLCTRHMHEMAHTVSSSATIANIVSWSFVNTDEERDNSRWFSISGQRAGEHLVGHHSEQFPTTAKMA
jgi:Fungal specific transcription factor domain